MRKGPKPELFYIDEDGKKQDAGFHAELLGGVDDLPLRVQTAAAVLATGVELSVVLEAYGLRPEDIRR